MAQQQKEANLNTTTSLLLSFVAGYVDSCTFLALFGLFVAQLTGSFVIAGAQIITENWQGAFLTTFAIPIFLVAGAATTLLVVFVGERGGSKLAWSLALESALLTGFLVVGVIGSPFGGPNAPLAVVAGLFGLLAMGVQSALWQLLMGGVPSTNVMTTNTTRIAILATQTVLSWHAQRRAGGDGATAQLATTRNHLAAVLLVAGGFLIGTIVGAFAYSAVDLWCLLLPIGALLGLLIRSLESPLPIVHES